MVGFAIAPAGRRLVATGEGRRGDRNPWNELIDESRPERAKEAHDVFIWSEIPSPLPGRACMTHRVHGSHPWLHSFAPLGRIHRRAASVQTSEVPIGYGVLIITCAGN